MANQTSPMVTRKSVTGFVTKLVGDGATYGFINDEIFFQQTNVTDGPAGNGDRVYAECEYSEHLPIKWNATSIKIIGRAGQQQAPASTILESDPRRQSRQAAGLLNQQPQQTQQSAPPQVQPQPVQAQPQPQLAQQQPQQPPMSVANTYQQHRQQRQQQQTHDTGINNQPHMQQQLPPPSMPMGILDQGSMNQPPPDFFSPFAQPPMQHQPGLQPFQHDTPMGPPKLEYTSQLGSAFVQNQFMPGPLLPPQQQQQQQAPPPQPMLPQIQPQQQQQQPQQQHQNMRQQHQNQNQQNQRNSRDNANKAGNVGGRFNDRNDKNNDRNQSNRGRNRNDNKSGERESPANSRSSRSSRDRSGNRNDSSCRGSKRDDSSTRANRQSPVNNSAKLAGGASSDRGHKPARRSYDNQNVPRGQILTNLNACNMRSRCSSSVHVPSDLNSIIVNKFIRLDIKNTPKPIVYKIEEQASSGADESKTTANDKDSTTGLVEATTDSNSQSSVERRSDQQKITPPTSKSDMKLGNKYGVKVVLISLPELEAIYKKVFGSEFDAYSDESKSHAKLDEAISLLCNKGSNGGHSLIGGKFDPVLDGFVEGEVNQFERHGRQPDLIATCQRVVKEQTGLDLGNCQGWTLVSTFLYNHKSEYFSSKASIEYSYIYLPHIWTIAADDLDKNLIEKEVIQMNSAPIPDHCTSESRDDTMTEENNGVLAEAEVEGETLVENPTSGADETNDAGDDAVTTTQHVSSITPDNISDLKVADLKLELDKRDVKYKPNAKKAELAQALHESLSANGQSIAAAAQAETETVETIQPEQTDEPTTGTTDQEQLEEGEVIADDDTTTDETIAEPELDPTPVLGDTQTSNKRKQCDEVKADEANGQELKKICNKEAEEEVTSKSDGKVSLINEPFRVRARPGQTQLSTITLYDAVQVSKYDQFELSVTSFLLRESLVQHLSEYIFTTLVEESRQRSKDTSDTASTSSSITNSQDTNISDTNNNSTSNNKLSSNNQTSSASASISGGGVILKEYPVDRYINLAFSYFDTTHMGYVHADDLFKLFNNSGLTISKRALYSLIGEGDKFNYRTLPDLSSKFPPTYVYRFPDQFSTLPGSFSTADGGSSSSTAAGKMIEYQGVKYDVDKMIQQARDAETTRVNMVERFNHAIENSDKQAEEIHVLEVSRMSLSKSIAALNNELSELKREKDSFEKRYELLRKGIKGTVSTLNDLVTSSKDEK